MTARATNAGGIAPRTTLLLPGAFLLHLGEEWIGGFSAWTELTLGNEVSPERFLLINTVAFLAFAVGTLAGLRYPRMAWFGVAFAALVGLNGALHAAATLGFARYSPGTITGLLLYIPLSAIVLRASAARLSRPVFARSVGGGLAMHGAIALLAFR
jgi:hypothetical protein